MSKAYICVKLLDEANGDMLHIDVYSEPANQLTRSFGDTRYMEICTFTGEDFAEASAEAHDYLFSDKFAQDFPQYVALLGMCQASENSVGEEPTESAQLRDLLELIGVTDVLRAHGLVAACLEAQDKLYSQRGYIQQCVGNLLAVIHRDGGHYMDEHGLEKACKDAEQIFYSLRAELDVLGESHDILVKSEDPW